MERDRDFLVLAILTFLTVVGWMFFELMKTTQTSTISTEVQELLTPLSPTIDIDTLTKLGRKKIY